MLKQPKFTENSSTSKNGLQARLQQIIDLLYKNNSQFPKGLPSQNQFKEILEHSYNCYDQLDFIFLQYSRHQVNYLDPKVVAENMHRIMRVTKYLLSNFKHWIQSYSLDILKKIYEEKNYFPNQANYQPKCSSCKHYIQEIVIKEAKEEIFGHMNVREMYEQELREEMEDKEERKPIIVKQATQYVGSVTYLTKIIKEMEESARGYNNLAENIERQDEKEDLALNYLAQLLTNMKRRLGEKCIYRLKKVLKNWEKNQCDQSCQKNSFTINQQLAYCIVPSESNELKKSINSATIKKLKEEIRQLQLQNHNLIANMGSIKTNLTYLQKREETSKKEIERLNQIIQEKSIEKKQFVYERSISKRNSINNQPFVLINAKSNKVTNSNANDNMKLFEKKSNRYSKFKVKRQSRQSQTLSNGTTNKTLDLTDYNNNNDCIESQEIDSQEPENIEIKEIKAVDVACQWQNLYPDDNGNKLKEKSSRSSKLKSNNREKIAIQKISKIIEQEDDKNKTLPVCITIENKPSAHNIDISSKHKKSIQKTNRLSLEQNQTAKKFIDVQQKSLQFDNFFGQELTKKKKTSVKLLQSQKSLQKLEMEKSSINVKIRQLNLGSGKGKITGNGKDVQKENDQYSFGREIKKMVNHRFATEGAEVKKKAKKVRNTIFKPENLSIFGGVSESYAFQKDKNQQPLNLNEEESNYLRQVKKHIENLGNFKNYFYENVVTFLAHPYTLIDKTQLQFRPLKEKELNKLLHKLIGIHKKKCEGINCQHLNTFNILIGFL